MGIDDQGVRGLAVGTVPIEQLTAVPAPSTLAIKEPAFAISYGRIDDVNEQAARLVGRPRGEIVGRPIADVIVAPDEVDVTRFAGFVPTIAGVGLRTGATTIAISLLVCPCTPTSQIVLVYPDARGKPSGWDGDDIAAIVHDLKSPLAAIALDTELLDMDTTLDPTVLAASVKRIVRNVAFLDRLIHDLLDLCAIDAGRLDLYRTRTELRALVESVLDRVVSARERLRLVAYVAERVTLEIDDVRIERVIANLLQNALKYAPAASAVVVRLEVTVACVRLSVIDAGPGIPAAEQESIFDRYRRGAPSRGGDGHGLGLFVSKRIIEAHGGRIGVDSVHGAGSRFFFELPRD